MNTYREIFQFIKSESGLKVKIKKAGSWKKEAGWTIGLKYQTVISKLLKRLKKLIDQAAFLSLHLHYFPLQTSLPFTH